MSAPSNIELSAYTASSITVSWNAPASGTPNNYTVTAQPGNLSSSGIAGTSVTLTATAGVAYFVTVTANYTTSSSSATATIISPPAALSVPMTTVVAPWLWYDAADPTTVRCNTSGVLTEWYNKGTSAGSTNGNVTMNGSPTTGAIINGRNAMALTYQNYCTTPSITPTAKDVAMFVVMSLPSTSGWQSGENVQILQGGLGHISANFVNNSGALLINTGFNGVANTMSNGNAASLSTLGTTPHLYTFLNSAATTANNYLGIDGSSVPVNGYNSTASGAYLTASTHMINQSGQLWSGGPFGKGSTMAEIIVVRADITATMRMRIEGYLAWKWGIQANLPSTHPYSTANMTATMGLYNRVRMYASTFVSSITNPRGQVFDSAGNLWVATQNNGVCKISPSGSTSTFLSGKTILNIAKDASDNIYATVFFDGNVSKITPSGTVTTHITCLVPGGIAVDNSGGFIYVYQADNVWRISRFSLSTGAYQTQFSPTTSQYLNGMLIIANGDILAANTTANRLERYNKTTGALTVFAGSGTASTNDAFGTDASFNQPAGLAVDALGNYYVGERSGAIRLVSPAGMVLTIAGSGGVSTIVNGLDSSSRYNVILGLSIHPSTGDVYISDNINNAIRKLSIGSLNQVGTLTTGNLGNPSKHVDGDYGNIYVGNNGTNNNHVTRVAANGVTTSIFVGSTTAGDANGAGTAATFRKPTGVIRDELGNLYIGEFEGARIRKVSPAGLVTTFASSVTSPLALTMGPDGNIYVVNFNGHRINKVSRTGAVTLYAGTGSTAPNDGANRLSAGFSNPTDIGFDSNGVMYIADMTNHRIRKIQNNIVTTFAGNGTASLTDGTGSGATMNRPYSITFDQGGNMYVANADHAVRKITPDAVVTTIAGASTSGSTDGVGTAARFNNPTYCRIDSNQNLWLTESGNNSVRHIAINLAPLGSVTITGTLTVGQTLTANTSTLADGDVLGTFSYAWSASATADGVFTTISGATASTYVLAENEAGKYIKVTVSYTDGRGSAESKAVVSGTAVVNPASPAQGSVSIVGSLLVGYALSSTNNITDANGLGTFNYTWSSSATENGVYSTIATTATYTLTSNEVGRYVKLAVSYVDGIGTNENVASVYRGPIVNTPEAPTITSVTEANEHGEAVVSFTAPATSAYSSILGYRITTSPETEMTEGASSPITIHGLSGATTYTINVVAYNANGSGATASISKAIAAYVPATMSAPTISSVGDGQVAIAWTAPNTGGSAITGYTITVSNVTDSTTTTTSAAAGASSKTITGLTNGKFYTFSIVATNGVGNSLTSLESNSAKPFTAPSAPTGVTAVGNSLSALVSWTVPANNGATILSYTIAAITGGSPVATKTVYGETTTSAYIYDLTNSTAYTFTVYATNAEGDSSASTPSSSIIPASNTQTSAITSLLSGNAAPLQSFISTVPTSTAAEKADATIDMRVAIKAATATATTEQKATAAINFIDAMRAKISSDNYTIPTEKFADFITTLTTTTGESLPPLPIVAFVPEYDAVTKTAEVVLDNTTSNEYVHIEVPIGYSFLLKNGNESVLLTFDGTQFSDGVDTYTSGSSIVLGNRTFTFVGIGSLTIKQELFVDVICVVKGSKVLTPAGNVNVEDLKVGDRVITCDGRIVPITKMRQTAVAKATTTNAPYVIEKDAFYINCPPERLNVSPRHAIMIKPGLWEIPVEAAKEKKDAVYQNKEALGQKVVYYHFSLQNYQSDNVIVNGQPTESMNDGSCLESYVWDNELKGYKRVYKPRVAANK